MQISQPIKLQSPISWFNAPPPPPALKRKSSARLSATGVATLPTPASIGLETARVGRQFSRTADQ